MQGYIYDAKDGNASSSLPERPTQVGWANIMFSSGLCPWSRKVVAEGRLNTIPCRYADRGANGRAFEEII